MGLVNDPIEYGVGEGRLADDIVPGVDGQLTGQEDRAGCCPHPMPSPGAGGRGDAARVVT